MGLDDLDDGVVAASLSALALVVSVCGGAMVARKNRAAIFSDTIKVVALFLQPIKFNH